MAMETEFGQLPSPVTERLVLCGTLTETARLSDWVQSLAARYRINDNLQFTIHLCLEETVSNIIRHGYGPSSANSPNAAQPVTIEFSRPRDGQFVFTVEDTAPHFNPLLAPEMPLLDSNGEPTIGGRGIRLLRAFAHQLEHQPTAQGNRLRISFSATPTQTSQP